MENTKKIIVLLVIVLLSSCDNSENYYNSNHKKITDLKDLKKVKLNLVIYKNQINILSDYIIEYGDENETINSKRQGLLLQDSIFSSKNNSYYLINDILDLSTYRQIEKNILYQDKNNIYYNVTSKGSNYPYYILDLKSSESKIFPGGYIKDMNTVYSYGGVICTKIDSINAENFNIIKVKDINNDSELYLGTDNKSIYWNESKITKQYIEDLPIPKKTKDSLSKKYFPDHKLLIGTEGN